MPVCRLLRNLEFRKKGNLKVLKKEFIPFFCVLWFLHYSFFLLSFLLFLIFRAVPAVNFVFNEDILGLSNRNHKSPKVYTKLLKFNILCNKSFWWISFLFSRHQIRRSSSIAASKLQIFYKNISKICAQRFITFSVRHIAFTWSTNMVSFFVRLCILLALSVFVYVYKNIHHIRTWGFDGQKVKNIRVSKLQIITFLEINIIILRCKIWTFFEA